MQRHFNKKFVYFFSALLFISLFARADFTVYDPGKEVFKDIINCNGFIGVISVHTGVTLAFDVDPQTFIIEGEEWTTVHVLESGFIGLGITGINAEECVWIQFIMFQVWVEKNGKKTALGPGSRKTSGGDMHYTNDEKNPQWAVDSASDTEPNYGSKGVSKKEPNLSSMFDRPDDPLDAVWDSMHQSDPEVTKIIVKYTFHTYLVCKRHVCYRIIWTMEQEWERGKGKSQTRTEIKNGEPNPELTENQKLALLKEYPDQTLLDLDGKKNDKLKKL